MRQYAQRSMLVYTVCSSDPRGAKGIGGDAAGCSDDLVHGHGQSHVGAGGGFHGVAHFVLHEADVTHGGGDVGVPQHTADKHDVAAVPVVDACGEPTAQAVRRVTVLILFAT